MSKSKKKSRSIRQHKRLNSLAIDQRFDRIVSETFKVKTPEVLYHYTDWAGAEGILTSRTFRATAHDCTNDEAELISADKIVIEVANHLRQTQNGKVAAALIGPNQNADEARQRIMSLLTVAGYKPGDMEYPEITVSTLPPWVPLANRLIAAGIGNLRP